MPGILLANRAGLTGHPIITIGVPPSTNSRTATAVTDAAAYVNNSDGAAVAQAFVARTTSPAKHIHWFKTAGTFTVEDPTLLYEIRDYESTTTLKPKTGAALASVAVASAAYNATANKWNRSPDLSSGAANLTVGQTYWAVIGNDNAAPATCYPTILTAQLMPGADESITTVLRPITTVTGFNTNGTGLSGHFLIIEHVDGTLTGAAPLTLSTGATWGAGNHARQRGAWWAGPSRALEIHGFNALNLTSLTHLDIFTGDQAPTATPVFTHTLTANQIAQNGVGWLPTPYVFEPNANGYVIAFRAGASIGSPRTIECENTSYANIDTIWPQAPEGGKWIACESDGGAPAKWVTGWDAGTNGTPSSFGTANTNLKYRVPAFMLLGYDLYQYTASAGSGGRSPRWRT